MKVLLSAYACEPGRGSEPGVGWNIARASAQHNEVWVFTSNTHRAAIEQELVHNPVPNLHFIYLDPFGWVYDWSQEGKRAHWDVHLHYYFWQIRAYYTARSLHQEINFDLAHHVTYVKYSSPSFLSLLPIPFIWGPIGGGESAPKSFWKDFSFRGKVYEISRNVARFLGEQDPFVQMTARRSRLIWATTEDTARRLYTLGATNIHVFSESGLSVEEIKQLADQSSPSISPARFISMARLLHWKGLHLGLRAFAKASLPDAEYWILGEGLERQRLETLAQELGISHQVKFWSRLPRNEALQKLAECTALVHPSLHDSGGWVCLESMAVGCPVVCLDLGGPAIQVTSETGFKISAISPEQTVEDMAIAINRLANNPDLRDCMGKKGQKHIQEFFNWNSKASLIARCYQEVLSGN